MHSKTLSQFCWKLIHLKAFKSCLLVIFTNSDLWQNEGAIHNFKIIDYAWISIMLFDLCWKW